MLENRRTGKVCVAPDGGSRIEVDKKVTADKEGAKPPLPRIVVERAPECLRTMKFTRHTGGCPGCAALASHGKARKPHNDECRGRITDGRCRGCAHGTWQRMMSRWPFDMRTHLAVT